jgi:hypothetical protein
LCAKREDRVLKAQHRMEARNRDLDMKPPTIGRCP